MIAVIAWAELFLAGDSLCVGELSCQKGLSEATQVQEGSTYHCGQWDVSCVLVFVVVVAAPPLTHQRTSGKP